MELAHKVRSLITGGFHRATKNSLVEIYQGVFSQSFNTRCSDCVRDAFDRLVLWDKENYKPWKLNNMRISVNLATIPSRVEYLPKVISSILDQEGARADVIRVTLNGFESVPECLNHELIEVIREDNRYGDGAKFLNAHLPNEYYFTIDDDLVYPKDYLKTHLDFLHGFDDRAIVTLHGGLVKQPCKNYYKDLYKIFACTGAVHTNEQAHIGGTGVMVFNTDILKISIEDFIYPNMSDIWVSKQAHGQGLPIWVRKHASSYLTYLNPEKNIHKDRMNDCPEETEQINLIQFIPMEASKELRYKFAKGCEDVKIILPQHRVVVDRHNLTNQLAEVILTIPAYRHNIEPVAGLEEVKKKDAADLEQGSGEPSALTSTGAPTDGKVSQPKRKKRDSE